MRDDRDTRSDEELLAAYCDGVTELDSDERRRVEALLAESSAAREDAAATRAVIGALRELPAEGTEPDWTALEHAIRAQVPDAVPRQWWRPVWRWLVPATALATLAVIAVITLRGDDPAAPREATPSVPVAATVDAGAIAPIAPTDEPAGQVAVLLDGVDVVLDAADDDVLEVDDLLLGEGDAGDAGVSGLLSADDLAWIDELDDDEAQFAEKWLDERKKG